MFATIGNSGRVFRRLQFVVLAARLQEEHSGHIAYILRLLQGTPQVQRGDDLHHVVVAIRRQICIISIRVDTVWHGSLYQRSEISARSVSQCYISGKIQRYFKKIIKFTIFWTHAIFFHTLMASLNK